MPAYRSWIWRTSLSASSLVAYAVCPSCHKNSRLLRGEDGRAHGRFDTGAARRVSAGSPVAVKSQMRLCLLSGMAGEGRGGDRFRARVVAVATGKATQHEQPMCEARQLFPLKWHTERV